MCAVQTTTLNNQSFMQSTENIKSVTTADIFSQTAEHRFIQQQTPSVCHVVNSHHLSSVSKDSVILSLI